MPATFEYTDSKNSISAFFVLLTLLVVVVAYLWVKMLRKRHDGYEELKPFLPDAGPNIQLDKDRLLQLIPRPLNKSSSQASEPPVFQEDQVVARLSHKGTTTLTVLGSDQTAGLRSHPAYNMSVMTLGAARRLHLDLYICDCPKGLDQGLKDQKAEPILRYVPNVPVQWHKLDTEIDFYITTEAMEPDISIGLEVLLNNGLCQFFSLDAKKKEESWISSPHPSVDLRTITKVKFPEIVMEADFEKADMLMYQTKIAITGRRPNVILKQFLKDNRVGDNPWFFKGQGKPKGLALMLDCEDTTDSVIVGKPVFKNSIPYTKDSGISFTVGTTFLAENSSVIDYGRRILFLRDILGELVPLELQVLSSEG